MRGKKITIKNVEFYLDEGDRLWWTLDRGQGGFLNSICSDFGGKDHMTSFIDWRPWGVTTQHKKPNGKLEGNAQVRFPFIKYENTLFGGGKHHYTLIEWLKEYWWFSTVVSLLWFHEPFLVCLHPSTSPQSQTANQPSSGWKALIKMPSTLLSPCLWLQYPPLRWDPPCSGFINWPEGENSQLEKWGGKKKLLEPFSGTEIVLWLRPLDLLLSGPLRRECA